MGMVYLFVGGIVRLCALPPKPNGKGKITGKVNFERRNFKRW